MFHSDRRSEYMAFTFRRLGAIGYMTPNEKEAIYFAKNI